MVSDGLNDSIQTNDSQRTRNNKTKDKKRKAEERANEAPVKKTKRKSENAERQAKLRKKSTEEHAQVIQELYDTNSTRSESYKHVKEYSLGLLNIECNKCGALHFAAEKIKKFKGSFNDCCKHGKVILPPLPDYPKELEDLFLGKGYSKKDTHHFYDRIRQINSSVSCASVNTNQYKFSANQRGPPVFRIQGI